MGKAIFRRSDDLYARKFSLSGIAFDPVTHVEIDVVDKPDVRLDRWDGATGIRAATQQETDDLDDAKIDAKSEAKLNSPLNKTLRDLFLDIEQRLRAAGQTSTISDIAAATNPAEYKTALKKIIKSHN